MSTYMVAAPTSEPTNSICQLLNVFDLVWDYNTSFLRIIEYCLCGLLTLVSCHFVRYCLSLFVIFFRFCCSVFLLAVHSWSVWTSIGKPFGQMSGGAWQAPSLAAIKRRFWLHSHSNAVFPRRMSKISSFLSAFSTSSVFSSRRIY